MKRSKIVRLMKLKETIFHLILSPYYPYKSHLPRIILNKSCSKLLEYQLRNRKVLQTDN